MIFKHYLYAHHQSLVLHFHFFLFELSFSKSVDFVLENSDVIDRWLKYRSFVGPNITHNFVVRLVVLRQQRAKFLDSIVDVESPTSFNWKWGNFSNWKRKFQSFSYSCCGCLSFVYLLLRLLRKLEVLLWFWCRPSCWSHTSKSPRKTRRSESHRCNLRPEMIQTKVDIKTFIVVMTKVSSDFKRILIQVSQKFFNFTKNFCVIKSCFHIEMWS